VFFCPGPPPNEPPFSFPHFRRLLIKWDNGLKLPPLETLVPPPGPCCITIPTIRSPGFSLSQVECRRFLPKDALPGLSFFPLTNRPGRNVHLPFDSWKLTGDGPASALFLASPLYVPSSFLSTETGGTCLSLRTLLTPSPLARFLKDAYSSSFRTFCAAVPTAEES